MDFEALKLMGYEMQEGQMPDSTTGYEGVVVFGSSAGYDFYNPKKNNWWNDRSGDPPVNVMRISWSWSSTRMTAPHPKR